MSSINDFSGENVLITGISGFVGPYLANSIIEKKGKVFGLIRKRADGTPPRNLIEMNLLDKVNLIKGDLTDITSLANAIKESEPDHIFHLGAQSYVPLSFKNPLETINSNCDGTANLLESVRISEFDPSIVFAGSSEEYGLVITSEEQYKRVLEKRKSIFPEPKEIPEIPIKETNPLRPMSPYGVTKVFGDHLIRNYFHSFGLDTKVSRAFNHEGARRGEQFVTSAITKQVMKFKYDEIDEIQIGNVNAFRDWSHVKDMVEGYQIISKRGESGEVYNQGSGRVNSVLSYILLSLGEAGYNVKSLSTINNEKYIENPIELNTEKIFGNKFKKTNVDEMILKDEIFFNKEDKGIVVKTDKGNVKIKFDPKRFRPAEVPVLLSNIDKIKGLGFSINYELRDIIKDQLNYYLDPKRRL